jgi:starvation-inducible DNA-binding protein
MNPSDYHPFLHTARIDIPPEIRAYLITLLHSTLSCSVELRSHIKRAMWTVKGADVLQLQALFATMATELETYADLVAERIAVLGGVAWGTTRTAATPSTLLEYPSDLIEGSAHVLALAERFAPYATVLRTSMKHATDIEDVGSAALYTDITRGVEKRLGLLEAHLHR